ncbi:CPBP family intramembrane metalloprotease [Halovenus sp. WSH3]|uniref:CPBP family intramembrane metalloprotease n=1 Tax=Halovenus carboxidivorans TaxID=2692199 RepID=A0A6B0T0S1_9EURY|nr:CPBP family intramembrane glutamic endopeptidase [Halovenus carboxidivorans]MXR50807.1 CPBP family intramembrane metalloprotease [Halovenus carboxidivorans]
MKTEREVSIDSDPTWLIVFLAVVAAYIVLNQLVDAAVTSETAVTQHAVETVWFLGLAAIGLGFLYLDDADAADIGLSRPFVAPGFGAFIAVWVGLNVVGVGLALASGNPWGADLLTSVSVGALAATMSYAFIEELVFRGYLQGKVRSVLGGNSWLSRAGAVVTAGVLFALAHVPRILVEGGYVSGVSVVGTLVVLTLSGAGFGIVYELTENLYFVGLLHGLGNSWPLLVDGFAWDGPAQTGFLVSIAILYLGVTVAYRRLTADTRVTPYVRIEKGNESAS